MCIRDSHGGPLLLRRFRTDTGNGPTEQDDRLVRAVPVHPCLLYTSDAADQRSSVDLGGRRIIKKKNNSYTQCSHISNHTSYSNSLHSTLTS